MCTKELYRSVLYRPYVVRTPCSPQSLEMFFQHVAVLAPITLFREGRKKKRAGVATFVKTIFVRRVLWHLLPKRFASQVPPSAASGTEGAN